MHAQVLFVVLLWIVLGVGMAWFDKTHPLSGKIIAKKHRVTVASRKTEEMDQTEKVIVMSDISHARETYDLTIENGKYHSVVGTDKDTWEAVSVGENYTMKKEDRLIF